MASKDHLRKGENTEVALSLVAGSVSGMMARTLTAPMDTVKIRLQVIPAGSKAGEIGIWKIITDLVRQEGLRGFWKGNVPGSAMYVVYGGVQFSSYSFYNNSLSGIGWTPQFHSWVVGALAGITSSIVSYPFDVLRTRFAVDRQVKLSSLSKTVGEIWSNKGYKGFFKGCCSSMLIISIGTSIMFGTYENIRVYCDLTRSEYGSKRWHRTLENSASSLGATLAKLVTFPLDTSRRRLVISDSTNFSPLTQKTAVYERHRGAGVFKIGLQILRHEGIFALYRGLPLALFKSVPTTALTFWAYEACMRVLAN
ncbi:TPC1 (YGR096W) [Zygosaccharomyces parabailii]|nr:TPC1 (YGR096W) [Zygosaccharomyces parabailii]CDH12449.1 related to Mitochondrial thiamine pyrophosphate carrier 1 [Zygosaccharomyces bailii ISA1307]